MRYSWKKEGFYILPSLTDSGVAYLMSVAANGMISVVAMVDIDDLDQAIELDYVYP